MAVEDAHNSCFTFVEHKEVVLVHCVLAALFAAELDAKWLEQGLVFGFKVFNCIAFIQQSLGGVEQQPVVMLLLLIGQVVNPTSNKDVAVFLVELLEWVENPRYW